MCVREWRLVFALIFCGAAGFAHAQAGSVVEFRGEASYRIPVVIPPGPAGHQPDLALVYNSGEGRGAAGWLGFGWALAGESRIERETRTASPYDFDNQTCGAGGLFPCYRPSYVLDGQDLICSSGSCSSCTSGAPCRYRTQSDDGRTLYFRGEASGWELRDREGRRLLYGAEVAGTGRLANPAGMIGAVFSWQLESSTDVNGNVIRYTYDAASSAGIAYLKKIEYGQGTTANRSIEFILNDAVSAARPDKPVSARAGFRQQTDRRVVSIEVRAASNALVTKYALAYTQDPDSLRSRLASVQRFGSDSATSLPPYRFLYSERAQGDGFKQTDEPGFKGSTSTCPPLGGLKTDVNGKNYWNIADLNRDGLADLYTLYPFNATEAGRVEVSLGTGTQFSPGPGASCGPTEVRGTPWSGDPLLFAQTWSTEQLQMSGSATLDLDGDGFLDHLDLNGSWTPSFPDPAGLRLGSATGFSPTALSTSMNLPHGWEFPYALPGADRTWIRFAIPTSGFFDTVTLLSDVTGDGRPDVIVARGPLGFQSFGESEPSISTWESWAGLAVFVNRGLKLGASGSAYLDFGNEAVFWPAVSGDSIERISYGLTRVALADQNGDGLPDRVTTDSVAYGYGAGFLGAEPLSNNLYFDLVVAPQYVQVGLYDLNGDGFLDYVAKQTSEADPYWHVHFGTGHGFNPSEKPFLRVVEIVDTSALESWGLGAASRSIRDVNGDGRLDYVSSGRGGIFLQEGVANHTGAKTEPVAGLLTKAVDPLGGTVEFSYAAAPQFQTATGMPANPGLPLAKPVVTRVVYSDGRSGTAAVANELAYADGVFDSAEKEFRGFGTVVVTQIENGVDGTQTTSTYRTDRICASSLASREIARGALVLERESMTYQTVTGGGAAPAQWTKCLPETRIVEAVEGNEAGKRARRTSWDYGSPINANYNLAKLVEWGEWDRTADRDVPGDERITELSYAFATSGWPTIVSRVSYEVTKDSAGNVYAKRKYCYNANCIVASKGLVTAVMDYLTDYTANPVVVDVAKKLVTIAYDAFGNPSLSTGAVTRDDADGLATRIAYDTTYQTFPTSISQGSDVGLPLRPLVSTLAYTGCAGDLTPPPALGLPCSVTAPQGQTDVFGYDALGRVKRVERPASAYVEARSYALSGSSSPGQNTLESRVVRSGFADLVLRQQVDGLSRVYRDESPGKQAQTVVIDRTYDDRGRLRTESLPHFTGSGPLRTFAYDALGRQASVLDPDAITQRVTTYSPWIQSEETYFGAATPGNRKERTERTSDGLGRLVRVARYADAVAATTPSVVTAKYDPTGRLYEVRDPIANDASLCTSLGMGERCATQDHVTEVSWDSLGRRVRIDDPDSGVWTWRYNDAGLVEERTQNGGTSAARSQRFAYDALGRLSAKTFTPTGSGVSNATFVYENDSAVPDFGQLIQVVAGDASGTTYLYGYDPAGRRDAVIQRTAGLEFGSAWEYDELDRVKRRIFPDGDTFDYGYDGLRLLNIRSAAENSAFSGKVLKYADYDALGRMKWIEIGEGAGNAALATHVYSYDGQSGRLVRVSGLPGRLLANDPDGDRVAATSDRCGNAYDPAQLDGGGLGAASAPDGIGDACQCGDVDGSGRVTSADATAIGAFVASATALAKPELCDVTGDGRCLGADQAAVAAAVASGTGALQKCLAARPWNLPSSAPLDLFVGFDGLGRLTSQTGYLGAVPVSRSYAYDGLSRLTTAVGPWEKATGATTSVTWTYAYDALGNLRQQTSNRAPASLADDRTWSYEHATKPHSLSAFAQRGRPTEDLSASLAGEVERIDRGAGSPPEALVWNAQNRLYRFKDSTRSYDVFDDVRLIVTGPSGDATSIVSVGDDFEYDVAAQRANKFFSLDGVRIASLATSYAAPVAATPPAVRFALRRLADIAAPAAAALLAASLVGLASLALRRRTPVWLSLPGVGVLAFVLVVPPYTAFAATLTTGPGRHGRHAEPILAYLVDHLGTIRGAVNQDGIVVETRDYTPFGESIAHAGAFSVEHRFTGQPQDDAAGGLYDYGARFFNPKWGRFVSPDESVEAFDAQGLNPYSYVLNRPTSATDPTGQMIVNGVSYGAWSTSTLQSGVLQQNPSSATASPGASAGGSALGFASGIRLIGSSSPAELAGLTLAPTPPLVVTIAKVAFTDLRALIIGPFSQFVINPFMSLGRVIDGLVNAKWGEVSHGLWQLAWGTLVPRYGLQNGAFWGLGWTDARLDSVVDEAAYEHDKLCRGGCSGDADRTWIRIAWSDRWRLGPYGQVYRLLGTAAFGTRILWRSVSGSERANDAR